MKRLLLLLVCASACVSGLAARAAAGGVGARVFIVERSSASLAVYDLAERRLLPERITGLGDLHHATMTFAPDLRYGFLATRSGQLTRIDLESLSVAGTVFTSKNSIDNAISQDGRFLAVAEYVPGGLSILDVATLQTIKHFPASFKRGDQEMDARVTGVVDGLGNTFVCVSIEAAEIWVVALGAAGPEIERRIPTLAAMPYDAMITPDGRYYLVGHVGTDSVSVLDLARLDAGVRAVSLRDPAETFVRTTPVKLPHMASWAVARGQVFVPLVGEKRLAVVDSATWTFARSVPLRGHPVYAVRAPSEREVWVSFSGDADDSFVQVVDTETLAVTRTLEIGGRIYHMDFTPRGAHVLVSANRDNKLVVVDANRYEIVDSEELRSPSGIFGVWRAFKTGL
ncbi:MAG: hypothetical protein HYV63_09235 [Candidatus Schekmanbacteria bacterium]|nr:hypothetical protein [Candidatus Schekmanbacteria bacterium]